MGRRTRAVPDAACRPGPRPGRDALRVLLAEDNPVNQRSRSRMLEKRGHESGSDNGQHAVDRTASERFDLVLIDVQMPEIDGLDATARIRAREREARSPRRPWWR